MPDGLIVERLPIGLARDMWRLHFVAWGSRSIWDEWSQRRSTTDPFRDRIRVEGIGGEIHPAGRGNGGSVKEQDYHLTFRADDEVSHVRVAYEHQGALVADEVVPLGDSVYRD